METRIPKNRSRMAMNMFYVIFAAEIILSIVIAATNPGRPFWALNEMLAGHFEHFSWSIFLFAPALVGGAMLILLVMCDYNNPDSDFQFYDELRDLIGIGMFLIWTVSFALSPITPAAITLGLLVSLGIVIGTRIVYPPSSLETPEWLTSWDPRIYTLLVRIAFFVGFCTSAVTTAIATVAYVRYSASPWLVVWAAFSGFLCAAFLRWSLVYEAHHSGEDITDHRSFSRRILDRGVIVAIVPSLLLAAFAKNDLVLMPVIAVAVIYLVADVVETVHLQRKEVRYGIGIVVLHAANAATIFAAALAQSNGVSFAYIFAFACTLFLAGAFLCDAFRRFDFAMQMILLGLLSCLFIVVLTVAAGFAMHYRIPTIFFLPPAVYLIGWIVGTVWLRSSR